MILYLTLGLCAIGAAALVYRYDLYDREPLLLLGAAVLLGAGGMALAGRLEAVIFGRFDTGAPIALALVGAVCEETLKLLAVVALAILARRAFNDPMDGLVYGSMAGLGAALEEGVAVLRAVAARGLLPPEELVRLCGHLVMGGIGGFGVGCVSIQGRRGTPAVAGSLGAAVLLHFAWDLRALRADAPWPSNALWGAGLMLAGLLLYGRLVVLGSRWSRQLFAPARPWRLWGWPWRR